MFRMGSWAKPFRIMRSNDSIEENPVQGRVVCTIAHEELSLLRGQN